MKKGIFIYLSTIMIFSCTPKLTKRVYTTVQAWKEWEIELKLNNDSTFTLVDRFGCNTFSYSGQWHYHKSLNFDFITLNDSTNSVYDKTHDAYIFYNRKSQKQQIVESAQYFPVIKLDTVLISNGRTLIFRNLKFNRRGFLGNRDLGKQREKIIEGFYVKKFGRQAFVKAFGDGKGIKQARKNIMQCNFHVMPLKFPGSN